MYWIYARSTHHHVKRSYPYLQNANNKKMCGRTFVKIIFATHLPALRESGYLLEPPLSKIILAHAWEPPRCLPPFLASSMLLALRIVRQLTGIVWFSFFLSSLRGQHTLASHRMIIRKATYQPWLL